MHICWKCRHHYYGEMADLCTVNPGTDPISGSAIFTPCQCRNGNGKCADYDRKPPSLWTRMKRWMGWEG